MVLNKSPVVGRGIREAERLPDKAKRPAVPGVQGFGWRQGGRHWFMQRALGTPSDQRLRGTALAVAFFAALVAVFATALKLASATSLACFTAFCTDS